jgi:hypothetical protein
VAYDYARARRVAGKQIGRFGGAALLRRDGVDRPCVAAILDYSPRDRNLMLEGSRRALISADGLDVPPNHEQDLLIFGGEVLRIVQPVIGPRPGGTAIYYEAQVVYQSAT